MANKLNTNPIVLDTFSAHVTIRPRNTGITVTKIVLYSAAKEDIFALEDGKDNLVAFVKQATDLNTQQDFGEGGLFCNGLVFDFDEYNTGLGAGDFALIYHK